MTPNIRIAVCISGQPRTWEKCLPQWQEFFSWWGHVDYFCHFWDTNSNSTLSTFQNNFTHITSISDEEKARIINALNPKKIVFEPQRNDITIHPNEIAKTIIAPWENGHSQFYSLKRVAFLKRQYEIENDFEYDFVVRLRGDMATQPNIPLPHIKTNTIYTTHNTEYDDYYNVPRFSDIFFASDSLTFDKISKFYDAIKFMDSDSVVAHGHGVPNDFPPEIALHYYCYMRGIHIEPLNGLHPLIRRTQEHFDAVGVLHDYETL